MESFLPRSQRKALVRNLDCLCSSLAINCCQFSCCMPDVPAVEFPPHCANQWMRDLVAFHPQVKLRDLVIPGTHDSASYGLSTYTLFSAAGRTQNVSVYEQLLRGARYLDIRVAGASQDKKEDVSIFHGCLQCGTLTQILSEIQSFLGEHPQEFIFVEIVPEYGRLYTDEQRLYTLQLIQQTFGDAIYTGHNYQQLMSHWTLAQVVTGQKKNLCIMVHPRIYKFEIDNKQYDEDVIVEEFGFVNSHRWMRSQWHNTREISQLKEWNLEEVRQHGNTARSGAGGKLLNNQLVLTPGVGSAMDVLQLLIGGNSLRPVSFAQALYQSDVLDEYFRDHADEAWNMIMLDYIDLTPALVCFLISLNFPPSLTILKAAIAPCGENGSDGQQQPQSLDVTDKIQQYVKRGRVLYLTNIAKDLELANQECGTLTLAYKLQKNGVDEYSVMSVQFDPETEIVLSLFCRNQDQCTHVCIPATEYPSGGCIKEGFICTKEAATATGNSTILEFSTNESNECVFGIVH